MMALGLVETLGLIGAIDCADVMLKAADVRLLEESLADGGLVTITVAGSVGAVQASVEAARASVGRIPGAKLVSAHVIPRPDLQLENILKLDPDAETPGTPGTPGGSAKPRADAADTKDDTADEADEADESDEADENGEGDAQSPADSGQAEDKADLFSEAALNQLSTGALRNLARKENLDLGGRLSQASKKALIQALLKARQ